jgi:uroporphyrinogen-III synthase
MRSDTTQHHPSPAPPLRRDTAASSRRLGGRRILLPADRALDRLAELLEGEGAIPVRCPLMTVVDAPDSEASRAWVRVLATGRFGIVVFLTAEGVACLAEVATNAGIRDGFLGGLRRARIVTRGAHPACALYELGIPVEARSAAATWQSVVQSLRGWKLAGQHVGVQICGDDSAGDLVRFLHAASAYPHVVEPYRPAPAADGHRVRQVLEQIDRRALDAVVFTAPTQVERLFQVAQQWDRTVALGRLHVTAIGQPVLARLDRFGVRVDVAPVPALLPRSLIDLLAARLGPARR